MATLKQRLHRKNASGTYDTVYFETSGDLITGVVPIAHGGTGATTAANARSTLGITPANIGAAANSHSHAATDITSGTINSALLPTTPVNKGGTGRTTLTSGYFLRGNGTGAITMSSVNDVKAELGVTSATPPSTTINVGSNVSMADIDWICVHMDSNYQYLMTKYIIGSVIFGQNTTYDGSNAALICMLFGHAIGIWGNESFRELTVNGVTGFCHIASYDQMNGGFSYFNSNSRRIATNQSGTAQSYWTSSPDSSSYVWNVNSDGGVNNYGGSPTYNVIGFRPFVALRR